MGKVQNVVNSIVDIWNDILGGNFNFTKTIATFYTIWSTLNVIEGSCHFYALIKDLLSLVSNPVMLIWRALHIIFVGTWTIVPSWLRMVYFGIIGRSFDSGVNLGRIVKAVFEFQIE